jgi:hypothetical protein
MPTLIRSAAITAEQRLMYAILEDALRMLTCEPASVHARVAADSRDWMLCDDVAWPFSFRNVCDALDIDVAALRERLEPWLSVGKRRQRAPGTVAGGGVEDGRPG